MRMGGLVSSSNRIADGAIPDRHEESGGCFHCVQVRSDQPLVWTAELQHAALLSALDSS
jgi:hypothetical protein